VVSKRVRALLWRGLLWIRGHPFRTLLLAILCLLPMKPISWGVTHFHPIDCGHFTYDGMSGKKTSSTTPELAAHCFLLAHQQCQAADIFYSSSGVDVKGETIFSTTNVLGSCSSTISSPLSTCSVGFAGCLTIGVLSPWFPGLICKGVKPGRNRFFSPNCSDDVRGRCLILDDEIEPGLKVIHLFPATEAVCMG